MAYVPDEACLLAARAAAGDELTQQEIIDAFRRVDEYRSSLEQAGDPVGRDARLSRSRLRKQSVRRSRPPWRAGTRPSTSSSATSWRSPSATCCRPA